MRLCTVGPVELIEGTFSPHLRQKENERFVERLSQAWQELRYGVRGLRKDRAFAVLSVFALALGIGATTVIFSVIDNVLLEPFPYKGADRLTDFFIRDTTKTEEFGRAGFSIPEYLDYKEQNHVFEGLIANRGLDISLPLFTPTMKEPHLSLENHRHLLDAARHKTRREVEQQVAALHPMPSAPSDVRKLPEKKPVTGPEIAHDVCVQNAPNIPVAPPASEPRPAAPPMPAIVRPLALERYKVQFTIGASCEHSRTSCDM
jgi:hypothetical protein